MSPGMNRSIETVWDSFRPRSARREGASALEEAQRIDVHLNAHGSGQPHRCQPVAHEAG